MRFTVTILSVLFFVSCNQPQKKSIHPPPYYLEDELTSPIMLADGEMTTSNGINFSNDGRILYTSQPIEKTFENGRPLMGIFEYHFENGKWGAPTQISFDMELDAYHPVLSADNQTLFFNSRSNPDSVNISVPHNIWFSNRLANGWSSPKMVEGINSLSYDSYPTITESNTLYFNSDRAGGKGGMDIYMSRFMNGKYETPVNVGELNSPDVENDLVIDPQERFIIFNRYIDSTKELDLYISNKKGDHWTGPRKLDKINKPDQWELTPTLSPDGKYFFYELEGKIMQIDLSQLTNY